MKEFGKDPDELYHILHQIVVVLSDLDGGSIRLAELFYRNKQRIYSEFIAFLENLEVYGAGYINDIDKVKYKDRNKQTHTEDAIAQLQVVIECLSQVQATLQDKPLSIFNSSTTFKKCLINMICFVQYQF